MFAVVVRTGVVVVVFERHVLCAFGGQVSEARVECTFLANDAAYLTLSRAVTQLRRSEIVTPGVGLTVCVVCGVSNGKVGFGRAFSLHSQSECIASMIWRALPLPILILAQWPFWAMENHNAKRRTRFDPEY